MAGKQKISQVETPEKAEAPIGMPETLPLASLRILLGEDDRLIQRIATKAGLETVAKGMYPVAGTIQAVKEHYKAKAEDVSSSRKADLDRKARNEADMSDIALAEKRGLFLFKTDVAQAWSDGMIAMRRAIQGAKTIPEELKPEMVRVMQSIKLNDNSLR